MCSRKCISICELSLPKGSIEKFIEYCMQKDGVKYERIYFGSNFCSQYFINMDDIYLEEVLNFCKQNSIYASLVIPILNENNLTKGKEKIDYIKKLFESFLDEITFNDYGMLQYLQSTYSTKLNIGRLLNKESRDLRYYEHRTTNYIPTISNEFLEIKNVYSIEFDVLNLVLDFSHIDLIPAVYYPYTYVSVGNVCEFASITRSIDMKFRPNLKCNNQCKNVFINYSTLFDEKYLKFGRTVYFKSEDFSILNCNNHRMIFEPIDLLIEWEAQQNYE